MKNAMGLLVALVALMAAPMTTAWVAPVITIGSMCAEACVGIDQELKLACINCWYGAGWVPVWSNASQPAYSVHRMPLVESGLPYAAAVPLQAPDAWTYQGMIGVGLAARQVYPDLPKNITICFQENFNERCVTRNMGPDAIIPNASSPTGLCVTNPGWLNLDPNCDGSANPYNNIKFNNPGQMANGYASGQNGRRMDEYLPFARQYARDLLEDVTVAADGIWYMNSVMWSSTMYYKKATAEHLSEFQAQFGADWSAEMTQKLNAGVLIYLDLATWMYDLNLTLSDTQMQPGTYGVFEKLTNSEGKVVARCLIFKLFDTGMKRVEPEVYTPAKSGTAWLIAMVYARSTVVFHNIRIGHFYTYHVVGSAQHYALYSTIDVGVPAKMSRHPIRMLLDEFTDPLIQNAIQLGTYRGLSDPPYVAIKSPFYHQMHNQFVMSGGPLGGGRADVYGLTPKAMVARSGFTAEDWTSPGGEPWDEYEQMKVQLETYEIVREYATKVVKIYYRNTKEMRQDKELQDFLDMMQAPLGSNLGRLNEKNAVVTLDDLGEIMGNIIYRPIIHASLHLLDFFKKNLNIVAGPTRIDTPFFPDPTATFLLADMMELMPDAFSMAQQLYQAFNIAMVSPQGGSWLQPMDGEPDVVDYAAALPFPNNRNKGPKANAAAIQFRQQIVDLFYNWPVNSCCLRQDDINFNWPWEMTTHIDF